MESKVQQHFNPASFDPILTFISEVESKYEEDQRASSAIVSTQLGNNTEKSLEYSKQIYRNLSEKGKKLLNIQGSLIEKSIEAYQYLTQKELLSNLGQNKDGVYYFVVYGHAYSRAQHPSEKQKMLSSLEFLLTTISEEHCWIMIYMHSGVSAFNKGALRSFKNIYTQMKEKHRDRLMRLYVVQPSVYLKARILVAERCIEPEIRCVFQVLSQFKKISEFVNFLKNTEQDQSMVIKFVKQLPRAILQIYKQELKTTKNLDIKEQEDLSMSIIVPGSELDSEPEFIKKYANNYEINSGDSTNASQISQTHDIIGKSLKLFYRSITEDNVELPLVFVQIYDYFQADETRFQQKELFKKQDHENLRLVDKLEQHFAMGDYGYIYSIDDASIVGCYFKSVLKYMEEPLCTYARYPKFKKICDKIYESTEDRTLNRLRKLMMDLEPIYYETWKFILHFFFLIQQNQAINKMTSKSIASMFADILLKPSEYVANDMVMWRMFTDLLNLMIRNNQKIFQKPKVNVDYPLIKIEEEKEEDMQLSINDMKSNF